MHTYYASVAGETYGPVRRDELEMWHRAGSLSPTDFIWDEPSGSWVEAIGIPELAGIFRNNPDDLVQPPPQDDPVHDDPESSAEIPPASQISNHSMEPDIPAMDLKNESVCANHEFEPSTTICPKCRRSLCERCMDQTGVLFICLDCVAAEKGAATKGWKRTALIAGCVMAVMGTLAGVYLFQSTPAVQPAVPQNIPLKRGAPLPELVTKEPAEISVSITETDTQIVSSETHPASE